jgi:hypothetical protein
MVGIVTWCARYVASAPMMSPGLLMKLACACHSCCVDTAAACWSG